MSAHTVCLTFDFDAISLWLGPFNARSPSMISRGEFGVIGAARILDLLARYQIQSTWFVPGHTIETYPEAIRRVIAEGHEIGHHGYCHENPVLLDEAKEREILERGIAAIERMTGHSPLGYRSPSWDLSPATIGLLLEYGFAYDSSMMGDDFAPYWCRQGDQYDTEHPFQFGQSVNLVEMPVYWGLDDFPAFEYVVIPQRNIQGLRSPNQVFDIWMGDFDYMMKYLPQGVYTLTMHPQVMGRGHRMLLLERIIEYMRAQGVRFSTLGDYVRAWKASLPADQHP